MTGIVVEHLDAVAHVRFTRPLTRNALNEEMIGALTEAYESLGHDKAVRTIVLSAEGKVFSAGADLAWMQRQSTNSFDENVRDAERFSDMLRAIYECPKPTVARVQGGAFAAGIGIMAAHDIVVAARDATFAITEAKLGIVPAVIGPYLVNAIGARAAKRLSLTAETFGADLAREIGLVHEVVDELDLDRTVDQHVKLLLANAPGAMNVIKTLFHIYQPGPIGVETRAFSARAMAQARATAEAREGFEAFFARRKPNWPLQE